MTRRGRGWIVAGAMALVVGVAAWLPGYRLDRELAAARAEGLWTESSDVRRDIGTVPEGQNAAPLIRAAIALGKARGLSKVTGSPTIHFFGDPMVNLLKGAATAAERREVEAFCRKNADLAARWRAAAARPRLVYGRPWEDGFAVLYPELAEVKRAVSFLAASARLGIEPKMNLVAAARLSALSKQEPALISALVGVATGRIALREARRLHLAKEVEAALGPPIDARRAYAFESFGILQTMRRLDDPAWFRAMGLNPDDQPPLDRILHGGRWKTNAMARDVHLWRELWREMPANGTDYAGAIHTLDRRMPAIAAHLAEYSPILRNMWGEPGDDVHSEAVRAFAKYESERRAIRDSRR